MLNSKIEKVRAGQPYLYRENGLPSEVYEVVFRENVDNEILNKALSNTIERYPYFKVKYQECDGDFYTVPNENDFVALETKELPVLGGKENNYYLIAVSHFDTTMYVSFHHGLTDGRGIKSFIESLVYYYCLEKYGTTEVPNGVLTKDVRYTDAESAEPCGERYRVEKAEKIEGISKKGFSIPETKLEKSSHRRYELKFSQKDFMNLCKSYGGTPITMLSIMMSRGISTLYPDAEKPINSHFPVDVRSELGVDGTYKNCVKSISLPYGEAEKNMSTEELNNHYKKLMKAQRSINHCKSEFNNIILLLNAISHLHSFKGKRSIMKMLDDLTVDTYIISYIGKFNFGENEKYIDAVHLYSNCSNGLSINMICACGNFYIDFVQDFETEKYIDALVNEFLKEGIALETSALIEFATPNDNLMKDMDYASSIIAPRESLWEKTVNANVSAYKFTERVAVDTMTNISDSFVKAFLLHEGETITQAKGRLREEQARRMAM
ncbi:MAG: hypothetical protein IJ675_04195 [Pseudobutyrivibrio sp.]|nr:hypothetical protein [Pseudobutyrivibrio sp.]